MGQHVQCAAAGFGVVREPVAPFAFPAADKAFDGTADRLADFACLDEFEQFDAARRITADETDGEQIGVAADERSQFLKFFRRTAKRLFAENRLACRHGGAKPFGMAVGRRRDDDEADFRIVHDFRHAGRRFDFRKLFHEGVHLGGIDVIRRDKTRMRML